MMNINQVSQSFVIENNETENYSFNLIHYFLDKHEYSIFNFEEKILENFNHEYYNIVIIYSFPLYNDVNLETLLEKLAIIKKRLRKNFFLFNQSILVIANNCGIDPKTVDLPKEVDLINATLKESLFQNDIIKDVYPDLIHYNLDLEFEVLSHRINALSLDYAKKLGKIFNKKQFIVNYVMSFIVLIIYSISLISDHLFERIKETLLMTPDNILRYRFYTLLTHGLVEEHLITVAVSLFLILTFGIRLEKIFGSLRYLVLMLLALVLSNAFTLAFSDPLNTGFYPVVYAFMGAFAYVIVIFRRFLAHTMKRIITFNLAFITFFLLFDELTTILLLIASFLSGFVSAFILGIPNTKNRNMFHRLMAVVFYFILTSLCIFIGLK